MIDERLKPKKKIKEYDQLSILKNNDEKIPITAAINYSNFGHLVFFVLLLITPFLLKLIGINLFTFQKPIPKNRDIEFVLVSQPEEEPINKKTPLRSDRNTKAGGQHDPNKPISPPQPVIPKSDGGAPAQAQKPQPQKVQQPPAPKQPKKVEQQPKQTTEQPVTKKPIAPKPDAKPTIPYTKSQNAMKIPIPPANGLPNISQKPAGPVTKAPSTYNGTQGSGSQASPRPMMASGGSQGSGGQSKGVASPGNGNMGNPGPGNPNGAPGVDAIKEPDFGPYMSDLQRRIKANWDPPRGDESKRVVLLFKIAKDGRLLSVRVVKSSGSQSADKAALSAVQLSAPFRALPKEFRGSDVDIQFTFDYNVFGAKSMR